MMTFGGAPIDGTVLAQNYGSWDQDVSFQSPFFDPFFPAPQFDTKIPSIVSNQPYTTYSGVPPKTMDAPTLTPWYKSWWDSSKSVGEKLWRAGEEITSVVPKTISTVSTVAGNVGKGIGSSLANNLPQYFMEKWGLVSRPGTGEKEAADGRASYNVYYPNMTQSRAPAVVSGFGTFMDKLLNQPKGTYSVGYPQYKAMTGQVPTDPRSQAGNLGLYIAIGLIAWLFFKR